MATTTPNIGLRRVDLNDQVDPELDLNGNWDVIDEALDGVQDTTAALVAGSAGQVLVADPSTDAKVAWSANPAPAVVTLTDGGSLAINAAAGKVFKLVAAGNRTIPAPTGAADGRAIIIVHTASGGDRTLALTTGVAGSFAFGSDFTGLTATVSGTTDYIGCTYDSGSSRWRVLSYSKGYA
jgi:hypothetical protein